MDTLEQLAIKKYLAKSEKERTPGPCCCVGPRSIIGFIKKQEPYNVQVKNESHRTKFIIQVHKFFKISLTEAKQKVDSFRVEFEDIHMCSWFQRELAEALIETKVIEFPSGLYPFCGCRMHRVVEIEDNFYKVIENNSQHKAYLLGKVGGPYIEHD